MEVTLKRPAKTAIVIEYQGAFLEINPMKLTLLALICLCSISLWAACPDTSLQETANDCPWAQMTRDILKSPQKCNSILKKKTPFLIPQLKLDQKAQASLQHWGLAKNFDENAKAIIVDNVVLLCLAQQLKLEDTLQQQPQYQTVHAGLQHTYAYLFSNTPTPYGYKRARWTSGDLKAGFNFELKNPLYPSSKNGAFLTNITYFFSRFAFKNDATLIAQLEAEGQKNKSLNTLLLSFPYEKFETQNLTEHVKSTDFVIHTVFVKMNADKIKSSNTHLLIYWIENTKTATKQLITGFPVETSFVRKALDPQNLGESKPITLRYNAYVEELTRSATPLTGLREVR